MMKATTAMSTASRQVNWSWRKRSYQFTARSARRFRMQNAECRMQTVQPPRLRSAFCILHSAFSRPSLFNRDEHPKKIHRLPHIVHPHHGRAGAVSGGDRGERADGALRAGVAAGEV